MSNKTKSNRGGARYRTVRRKHRYVPRRHRNNSRKHSLSGIPRRIMQQMRMAKIQRQIESTQAMARGSPPSSPSTSYSRLNSRRLNSRRLNSRSLRAVNRAIGAMGSLGSKYMPISHKKRRQSHRMSVNK
jgi:hypothetical protein